MSTLDYIIIGFIAVGGIWGAIKGLIDELSDKFGYVLGLAVALMFSVVLSPVFQEKLDLPPWLSSFLSYVILFLVGFVIMKILGKILEGITETAHLGPANKILGFILGAAEAVVVAGLVETLLRGQSLINVAPYLSSSVVSSKFIMPVFDSIRSWIQSL